jgi:hypothetical protein
MNLEIYFPKNTVFYKENQNRNLFSITTVDEITSQLTHTTRNVKGSSLG